MITTDCDLFLDSVSGNILSLAGGLICLLDCNNERDPNLLNRRQLRLASRFLEELSAQSDPRSRSRSSTKTLSQRVKHLKQMFGRSLSR